MKSATLACPTERSTRIDRALVAAFLEKVPDYVYFKDRHSRFITVSRSLVEYFGRKAASEVVGCTDFDFFPDAEARAMLDVEERILRTGQPVLGKVECQARKDGALAWIVSNKLPLKNEHGVIIGTFGLIKDITKTRPMEAELDRAHKELVDASRTAGMAEVATGVLHNVGNVLNSLNVSASVIADGL